MHNQPNPIPVSSEQIILTPHPNYTEITQNQNFNIK